MKLSKSLYILICTTLLSTSPILMAEDTGDMSAVDLMTQFIEQVEAQSIARSGFTVTLTANTLREIELFDAVFSTVFYSGGKSFKVGSVVVPVAQLKLKVYCRDINDDVNFDLSEFVNYAETSVPTTGDNSVDRPKVVSIFTREAFEAPDTPDEPEAGSIEIGGIDEGYDDNEGMGHELDWSFVEDPATLIDEPNIDDPLATAEQRFQFNAAMDEIYSEAGVVRYNAEQESEYEGTKRLIDTLLDWAVLRKKTGSSVPYGFFKVLDQFVAYTGDLELISEIEDVQYMRVCTEVIRDNGPDIGPFKK